ncbi:MAG: WD40 repeat domain-containing protein [Gemmataceae bacterium]|nr:WD40 repeat domain-containing protein [Gemmataceae bacterium]MCI0737682.1 WD40 repeat domain-containing protein [Gemmataceae bacterium]
MLSTKRAILLFLLAFTLCNSSKAIEPPVDLAGDPLPDGALVRLGSTRWRHGAVIAYTLHAPDGQTVITASTDGVIRVWDARSGRHLRSFGQAWNPVGGDEGQFHASDGPNAAVMMPKVILNALALSKDGKLLAAGTSGGQLTIWNVATGQDRVKTTPISERAIAGLVFGPEDKYVVAKTNDQVVRFLDLDGKEFRAFAAWPDGASKNMSFGVTRDLLGFCKKDTSLFATSRGVEKGVSFLSVKQWNVETGTELPELRIGPYPSEVLAASVDGNKLLLLKDYALVLWDLEAGKEIRKLFSDEKGNPVSLAAFSPDGAWIATRRNFNRTLQLWQAATGKEVWRHNDQFDSGFRGYAFSNLTFSSDSKRLASGTAATVLRQWDVASGKELESAPGHAGAVFALALAEGGKRVVTYSEDERLIAWDLATGKLVTSIQRRLPYYFSNTTHFALAYDGSALFLGGRQFPEAQFYYWNPDKKPNPKERADWKAHQGEAFGVALSPDGKTAATRGRDNTTRLWDVAVRKEIRKLPEPVPLQEKPNNAVSGYFGNATPTLLFSADGTKLASLLPNPALRYYDSRRANMITSVRVWDAVTGKLAVPHELAVAGIACFAIAPDGRSVAASCYDGTIQQWETLTGKNRMKMPAIPKGAMVALAFSADGLLLAGAGQDHVIRVWHRYDGKLLAKYKGHLGPVTSLLFDRESKRLISGSRDTTALVWKVPELPEQATKSLAADELRRLWKEIAGDDAGLASQAISAFASQGNVAVSFFKDHLRPIPPANADILAKLIADLDSDQLVVRQQATVAIEKIGDVAEPALEEALRGKLRLETQRRIEKILEGWLIEQMPGPNELQQLRALEALERIKNSDARSLVAALAKGAAGARLTREAERMLKRMQP